ncbi:unnamed protein product [Blepharisma stoltei]|uniref:Uncharacterized protein n=1 Tax=Blepharisma stoltei TaxID=1481888 RepID=A0AAU9J1L3_9CILI|nr:unnamed protein product [Blepharisma stoltei]
MENSPSPLFTPPEYNTPASEIKIETYSPEKISEKSTVRSLDGSNKILCTTADLLKSLENHNMEFDEENTFISPNNDCANIRSDSPLVEPIIDPLLTLNSEYSENASEDSSLLETKSPKIEPSVDPFVSPRKQDSDGYIDELLLTKPLYLSEKNMLLNQDIKKTGHSSLSHNSSISTRHGYDSPYVDPIVEPLLDDPLDTIKDDSSIVEPIIDPLLTLASSTSENCSVIIEPLLEPLMDTSFIEAFSENEVSFSQKKSSIDFIVAHKQDKSSLGFDGEFMLDVPSFQNFDNSTRYSLATMAFLNQVSEIISEAIRRKCNSGFKKLASPVLEKQQIQLINLKTYSRWLHLKHKSQHLTPSEKKDIKAQCLERMIMTGRINLEQRALWRWNLKSFGVKLHPPYWRSQKQCSGIELLESIVVKSGIRHFDLLKRSFLNWVNIVNFEKFLDSNAEIIEEVTDVIEEVHISKVTKNADGEIIEVEEKDLTNSRVGLALIKHALRKVINNGFYRWKMQTKLLRPVKAPTKSNALLKSVFRNLGHILTKITRKSFNGWKTNIKLEKIKKTMPKVRKEMTFQNTKNIKAIICNLQHILKVPLLQAWMKWNQEEYEFEEEEVIVQNIKVTNRSFTSFSILHKPLCVIEFEISVQTNNDFDIPSRRDSVKSSKSNPPPQETPNLYLKGEAAERMEELVPYMQTVSKKRHLLEGFMVIKWLDRSNNLHLQNLKLKAMMSRLISKEATPLKCLYSWRLNTLRS